MKEKINIDDDFLARYWAGEITPDESIALEDWLEEREENNIIFRQSQVAWEILSKKKWKESEALDFLSIQSRIRKPAQSRKLLFTPWRIAASILFLMGCVLMYYFGTVHTPGTAEEQWTTQVAADSSINIPLQDGSRVTLNSGSSLSFPQEFQSNERKVKFTGEGFFIVTRKAGAPFIIEFDGGRVEVLGTQFNVLADPASQVVEIQVKEGRVRLSSDSQRVILEKAQIGFLDRQTNRIWKQAVQTENNLAYATKMLMFQDESLSSVFESLAHAYGVKFEIENEHIKECKFTGTFQDKHLTLILDVISYAFDLQYRIDNAVVSITGAGCL